MIPVIAQTESDDLIERYISQLVALLGTPLGIVSAAIFGGSFLIIVLFPSSKWLFLTILLAAVACGKSAAEVKFGQYLSFPFEQIRNAARLIVVAMLCILMIPSITATRGSRHVLVAPAVIAMLVMQMIIIFRDMSAGYLIRGFASIPTCIAIFIVLAVGLGKWLQSVRDAHKLLYCVAIGAMGITAINLFEAVVNPSGAIRQGRLGGMGGNAQFTGMYVAIALPILAYLVVCPSVRKLFRICFFAAIPFMIVVQIWTGSRTGIIVLAIGMALAFRSKLGIFSFLITMVAGLLYFVVSFFVESLVTAERLVSTENTRAEIWQQMWNDFLSSPMFGVVDEYRRESESLYLSIASQYGFVGLIPLCIFIGFLIAVIVRLQQCRRGLGEWRMLADLVVAGIIQLLIAGVFEGYLMATLGFSVFILMVYLAIATLMVDKSTIRYEQPMILESV